MDHQRSPKIIIRFKYSFRSVSFFLSLYLGLTTGQVRDSQPFWLTRVLSALYMRIGLDRRRQWHPTPVLLPENPMDGGAWWAAVHGVTKSWAGLSHFTFTFHFHALEKEMATHSSVLAWRIPGTGEPGGLPSMGSHRVRHN